MYFVAIELASFLHFNQHLGLVLGKFSDHAYRFQRHRRALCPKSTTWILYSTNQECIEPDKNRHKRKIPCRQIKSSKHELNEKTTKAKMEGLPYLDQGWSYSISTYTGEHFWWDNKWQSVLQNMFAVRKANSVLSKFPTTRSCIL